MELIFSFAGRAGDLPQALLASSLHSTDCEACNGTGYVLAPNGPDDVDKEICPNCGGSGREVAND